MKDDIYTKYAAIIFKKSEKDITKDERSEAKKVAHYINYGPKEKTK